MVSEPPGSFLIPPPPSCLVYSSLRPRFEFIYRRTPVSSGKTCEDALTKHSLVLSRKCGRLYILHIERRGPKSLGSVFPVYLLVCSTFFCEVYACLCCFLMRFFVCKYQSTRTPASRYRPFREPEFKEGGPVSLLRDR